MTEFVLIIHDVADYPAWKQVFDDAATLRRDAGEISFQVLSDQSRPDRIVHFSRWSSTKAARAFFESPRLVEIRKQAGVHAPEFIYLTERDAGLL